MGIKGIFSFSIGEIISRAGNWLLFFILPFFISSELYGEISLYMITIQLVSSLLIFGQNKVIIRYTSGSDRDTTILSNSIAIFLIVYTLFSILVLISYELGFLLQKSNITLSSFLAILYIIFYQSLRQITLSQLVAKDKSQSFFYNQTAYSLIRLVSITTTVVIFKNVNAYIYAAFIVSLIFTGYDILLISTHVKFKIDRKKVKKYALFGLPLILNVLAGNVLSYIDRIFLEYYYSFKEVGIYTFAYSFSSGIAFAFAPLVLIFESRIYRSQKSIVRKILLGTFNNLCILILSFLSLIIIFLFPVLDNIFMNDAYSSMRYIIYAILGANILNTFYLEGNFKLIIAEKTKWIPLFTVFAGVINIVLNILFIPSFGIVGAVYATFFSYLLQAIAIQFISNLLDRKLNLGMSKWNIVYLSILVLGSISQFFFIISLLLLMGITSFRIYPIRRKIMKLVTI